MSCVSKAAIRPRNNNRVLFVFALRRATSSFGSRRVLLIRGYHVVRACDGYNASARFINQHKCGASTARVFLSSCCSKMSSATLRRARFTTNSDNSSGNVPAPINVSLPVDLQTSAKIEGEESQIATIQLLPGQSIRAESGSMLYMTEGIEMETSSNMSDGMKRFLTGQALFVTDFTNRSTSNKAAELALGTSFPSKIVRLNLAEYEHKLVCQKGAYLASNSSNVTLDMEFTKTMTAGFFGGQGFVLQKLEGDGDVLLQAGGTLVKRELEEGETLRISSGNLVAMTRDVEYDVQMMPGFKNVMFGGEGLFITTLKGPGTIWLQGMPPDKMISEIARRVPGGMGVPLPIPMGGGGGVGEDGNESAEEAADGADGAGSEEMVATSDAAIEADRQATVASSGMMGDSDDADSPSALFGDAVPDDASSSSPPPPLEEEQSMWGSSNSSGDTTSNDFFGGDQTDVGDETTFSTDDNDSFGKDFQDDTSFFGGDDGGSGNGMSDMLDGASGEETKSAFDSILRTFMDLFSDDQ